MANFVNGNTVTTDIIEQIVNKFTYADEQTKKAAFDAVNNSIYPETDLDELNDVALSFAVSPDYKEG